MNNTQAPAKGVRTGDRIEHDLMPGFVMTVEAAGPCTTDSFRSEKHDSYRITDPEGNTDWLCAYDVHQVGR